MSALSDGWLDFGRLDDLARRDSPIHRLDARIKVIVCLVFVLVVASFGPYQLLPLLILLPFPLAVLLAARLPFGFLAKRLALVAPFALMVGIFNPWLDRRLLVEWGPLAISAGWISFAAIVLRFLLSVGSALLLIAVTGFPQICQALKRLGVPGVFVTQLLFLYRYIFVLGDEARRLVRARALRSFRGRGQGVKVYGALLAQLLWRSIDRAQRVHQAMLGRGFDHEVRLLDRQGLRLVDWAVLGGCLLALLAVRLLFSRSGLDGALWGGVS